jgi:hypothetical protein
MLDQFDAIENKDYDLLNVQQVRKQGVITMENKSSHVLRVLNQFDPIENKYYLLTNVGQQIKPGRGGGVKHTKEYWGGLRSPLWRQAVA